MSNNTFDSASYMSMELLRFTTAGSVDDGKSTLIGRLLYDSKSIFEDQMEAVKASSEKRGDDHINLALVTDGLKSEREQGITIDVAYRYFSTPKRKFIIADTPGHIQYTRNMVTGASTANLAIVLVDARKGIIEQTKRHSLIASLLGIPHVTICINKMDLVDYDQATYENIKADYKRFASKLHVKDVTFIPISALHGDNVVNASEKTPWYNGTTLMYHLENVHIANDRNYIDGRYPVQTVIRPQSDAFHDFRGYAGRVSGGVFRAGDEVKAWPSGFVTKIKAIHCDNQEVEEAFDPMSVVMTLEDEIDISRGDMITRSNNEPKTGQDIDAMVCWMDDSKSLQLGGKYTLIHTTKQCRCVVKSIEYRMDINTLSKDQENRTIGLNDIGRIKLRTTVPLFYDEYSRNRVTGSFILVDEGSNVTVGACMIRS